MAVAEHARVAILRYRYHDADLAADRTGVYGYQAVCQCGWRGERRREISTARRDLRAHVEWAHANRGKGADDARDDTAD
jgi:hypothetical protein